MPGGALTTSWAGEARPDVLDLAEDAQAVLGEQVELGDLRAVVLDVEGQRGRRRLGRGDVARVVGSRRSRASVAPSPVSPSAAPSVFSVQAARQQAPDAPRGAARRGYGFLREAGARGGVDGVRGAAAAGRRRRNSAIRGRRRGPRRRPRDGRGREKLKTPLSRVAYQLSGSIVVRDVEGQVVEAGQDAGLLQVVHAVGQHAGGDEDQEAAGPGEERRQVDLIAPR